MTDGRKSEKMINERGLFRELDMIASICAGPIGTASSEALGLWTIRIGANAGWQLDFEGSNHYLLSHAPIINIQRADSRQPFISPRDSSGIALFDTGALRAGRRCRHVPSRAESRRSSRTERSL
jgi:outer membrane scaffolding protein for murein synthesis (MipA/OmpV family)